MKFSSLAQCLSYIHVHFHQVDPGPGGDPAYLYRGECGTWSETLTRMDRYVFSDDAEIRDIVAEELDHVTAYVMSARFPTILDAKMRAAYGQHYGFPTQIYDFGASLDVAAYFASTDDVSPEHPVGFIGVLDVKAAREKKACALFDLRKHPNAVRAQRQAAFGLIYSAFTLGPSDLKNHECAQALGLKWFAFDHHVGEHSRLLEQRKFLIDIENDLGADLAERFVDEYVATQGPLNSLTAKTLGELIPPTVGRTVESNTAACSRRT